MDRENVTVAAPAAKVFAVLADPTAHAAIQAIRRPADGGGEGRLTDSLRHLAGLVAGRGLLAQ